VTPEGERARWKVSVVIPALDEEATIADVIAAVRPHAHEVLVVDGHSADRTREVSEAMGVTTLLDEGRGKGDAIRAGLRAASHPIVVFVDADGSHEAADIPKLVEPIRRGEAELVVGSRMTGGSDELFSDAAELIRLTGSMVINLAINYRWKVRLSDTQNGFRAIARDVGSSLRLQERSTTIEQEMVMEALASGHRVVNLPSHEYRRKGGASKVIVSRVWPRYVWNVLKHVIRPDRSPARGQRPGPARRDAARDGVRAYGPARTAGDATSE
jgi:dolichol-phosphate mannosyltransferase